MLSLILTKNIYLKKNYIIFLKSILNTYIKNIRIKSNDIWLKCISKNLYTLNLFFSKNTLGQFKVLTDIACYDCPGKNFRFGLVYNVLSLNLNYRLFIQTKIKEKSPVISTLTGLYPGAGWLEREVWDFFGIFFFNHIDLRRILTDYGFSGYPLRKDFPLSGFIEVVYDDSEKQVVYKNLNLAQDYRNYKFKNTWKEYIS